MKIILTELTLAFISELIRYQTKLRVFKGLGDAILLPTSVEVCEMTTRLQLSDRIMVSSWLLIKCDISESNQLTA